jgi:hypothetical protein
MSKVRYGHACMIGIPRGPHEDSLLQEAPYKVSVELRKHRQGGRDTLAVVGTIQCAIADRNGG